jgi:predicted regulator of Ras-like GTPase activity (Roadblock/LC7/MglB family)
MSGEAFGRSLRRISERVPGTRLVMVIGIDGIPIERYGGDDALNLEAVAAEYTTLFRSSAAGADDVGLGELRELTVRAERMTALLLSITTEYFLFGVFEPDTFVGQARFALLTASLDLQREFQ